MKSRTGPTILGINRTQDGSMCLLHDGQVLVAVAKERFSRRKHDWGALGDFDQFYAPNIPELLAYPIDAVVECHSTQQPTRAEKRAYREELEKALKLAPGAEFLEISHHYAHLYSAFDPSGFSEAAVMIIDAQGSHLDDLTEESPAKHGDPNLREIMSFYSCHAGVKKCVGKQAWNGELESVSGLGMFYNLLTRTFFKGEGSEGKVMGLAPWGNAERLGMPALEIRDHCVYFPARWKKELLTAPEHHNSLGDATEFQRAADFAAAGQQAFEDAVINIGRWLHEETGQENLCFAGGTALNCSANTRLLTDTPFRRLFVPPAPHDAGTALGCALYGNEKLTGGANEFRWGNDYLGPKLSRLTGLPAVEDDEDLIVETPESLWDEAADMLAAGLTVGIAHGRSEFGPRALGNRSILADARRRDMKDHINRNIKGREWFRPLAPVVPLDEVSTYFELEGACPFMQWTAKVRVEYQDRLPAIVHCDGTARLQTVTPEQNPELYHLLKIFGRRSGMSVLLNTSFNGKDEPIVESVNDVLRCLRTTPLDAVIMPPILVSKPRAKRAADVSFRASLAG